MSLTWNWDPRPLNRAVSAWKKKGLTDAARYGKAAIRARLATEGQPRYRRSRRGESPRYETKDLFKSWQFLVKAPSNYSDIYSNLNYSYFLEKGAHATFGYIGPRPYIRVTLMQDEPYFLMFLTQALP